MDITVCIATIPPRTEQLIRALISVAVQTLRPAAVIVESDPDRTGAPATKNRALAQVRTDWVAYVDDDDWLYPQHLEKLAQSANNADVVYSRAFIPERPGFEIPGQRGPFNPDALRECNYICSNSLFRTSKLREAGGFQHAPASTYDDWGAFLALLDAGATFAHVDEQTFAYSFHGANTGGMADRW